MCVYLCIHGYSLCMHYVYINTRMHKYLNMYVCVCIMYTYVKMIFVPSTYFLLISNIAKYRIGILFYQAKSLNMNKPP